MLKITEWTEEDKSNTRWAFRVYGKGLAQGYDKYIVINANNEKEAFREGCKQIDDMENADLWNKCLRLNGYSLSEVDLF